MLASFTTVFLPLSCFCCHRRYRIRRLCLHLPPSLHSVSLPLSVHANTSRSLKDASAASPDCDLNDIPVTNAAPDATIYQTLTSRQKEQISLFVSTLLEWNERINLMSATQENNLMKRHVEDSLALLSPLLRSYLSRCCPSSSPSACESLRVVDVGSGSGFPGLILAIACPTWKITLLESMKKRCFFLEHVISLIGMSNVEVLRDRAENVGQCLYFRELFDVAVARAVAEMRILAEYCLPLVRVGGLLIAAKGHNPQEEVRNSEKAIQLMGGSMVELCTVESYSPFGQRTAVICFKEHPTPKVYPRSAGVPSKNPL